MTKNEIVARWMGLTPTSEGYYWISYDNIGEDICYHPDHLKYDSDRNWLHEAWVKFRDLKFDYEDTFSMVSLVSISIKHERICEKIEYAITKQSITEAFDELCKGIEWVESLKF